MTEAAITGLSVDRIVKDYPSGGGVDVGAIQFEAGKLIALIGPNGAGKSTLIKALVGALDAQIDGLSYSGTAITDPRQRARLLAYLSQTRTGPALASVRDVVALGRFPFGGQDPEGRVARVIEQLGLTALTDRRFGTLSGGEQARVLLGRALAVDAPVLLVDEPTASLDPHYVLRILEALRQEAQRGRTVIVSLHDLALAQRYCDTAIVLSGGKIVAQGSFETALTPDILRDVFRIRQTPNGYEPQ